MAYRTWHKHLGLSLLPLALTASCAQSDSAVEEEEEYFDPETALDESQGSQQDTNAGNADSPSSAQPAAGASNNRGSQGSQSGSSNNSSSNGNKANTGSSSTGSGSSGSRPSGGQSSSSAASGSTPAGASPQTGGSSGAGATPTTSGKATYTGQCSASGKAPLIDDLEDDNYRIATDDSRLGVWYTFNAGGSCAQTPVVDRNTHFKPSSPGAANSRLAAATTGRDCRSTSWAGGGIGFEFLSSYDEATDKPVRCVKGYDASPYKGLSFDIRSAGNVRIQVCTASVTDFNCHGYDIISQGSAWRSVTIPWIQLLQEDWGPTTRVIPFNPGEILSVQFKATVAQFDFAIDNLKFIQDSGSTVQPGAGNWHAFKASVSRASLQTEYDNWKSRHLSHCGDGSADVTINGQDSVSEGTGYGLLLAVGLDDRATFDRLLKGFDKRKNPRNMMSWKFQTCGGVTASGAATDADLDIALALLQADKRWGGYRDRAETLISALKQYGTSECDGLTVLRPGDNWGGCADRVDTRLNPSYFAPGYYRVFAKYIPNQAYFWNDLINDTYTLLAKYQSKMGGLLPDWGFSNGDASGNYWYDACRVPWRIATDYAWSGNSQAKTLLQNMYNYVDSRGGPGAAAGEKNSCFVGGFALTATAISQSKTDAWFGDWMRSVPQSPDPSVGDNPYFQGTLRVLTLMQASGQFQSLL